jgi:hypothetical protein
VYPGCDGLDDPANWETVSAFDLILHLVDFSGLRPVLAYLLGWTSARGQVPFDPVSMFLLVSWRLVNGWKRSTALEKIKQSRYADYARLFGFHDGDFPTEGGLRYFLTTMGRNSDAHGETVSVAVDKERAVNIAIQHLNYLLAGSVALLLAAHLIPAPSWQQALICPDGQIHDAASGMRCVSVQEDCYRPTCAQHPRACPAKAKGKRGCDCESLRCARVCHYAPARDPEARSVYYQGTNRPVTSPNGSTDAAAKQSKGELRYGYRSLALQFADPLRRFSLVLLDDFMSANAREENPATALLLQLAPFYPDLKVDVAAGAAGLGYYAFLHASYQLKAKRVVDLRADPSDKDKLQWTIRGYDDKGRPVCPYGYAFTANGFDKDKHRHKWFCGQACRNGRTPRVRLPDVTYPPQECPSRNHGSSHGRVVNIAETFDNGSIRLVRDIPVGSPTWKRFYHRARNAAEDRNADLQAWGLKRLPVYGQPRGRALIALADAWINLTTLARLVKEATLVARTARTQLN